MKFVYKEENYPYFYASPSGRLKGVLLDLWRTVSALRREEFSVEKIPSSELSDDCLPSNAFSYISPRTLSPDQTHSYHFSTWVFVEPTKESFEIIPQVMFYFVFSFNVLLLIVIAHLLTFLLEKAIRWVRRSGKKKRIRGRPEWLIGYVDLARLSCLLLSFFILNLTWQGYFNGNTMMTVEKQGTIFSLLVSQFQSGSRKLVIERGVDYFNEGEAFTLFGGSANFIYGDSVDERLRMTCADFSRVGYFYETNFLLYQTNPALQSLCNLARVNLLPDESTPIPWLTQNMREGRAVFYQLHRNETRKNREMIDFLLLSVYRFENLEGSLMMRHLDTRDLLNGIDFQMSRYFSLETPVMDMGQFWIPLGILFFGLAGSFLIFICECI
ncbi:hypothetical protein PMAYCL1PPCAC_15597, partial [Pristionchus mayeri]